MMSHATSEIFDKAIRGAVHPGSDAVSSFAPMQIEPTGARGDALRIEAAVHGMGQTHSTLSL